MELIVRGAPQEYVCRIGAWETLPEHLKRRDITKLLIITGQKSWQKAQSTFPKLPNIKTHFELYSGESTDGERDRIMCVAKEIQAEAIIAVGGGKVTDLAKSAAHLLAVPVIILPTLAATCAAYTPLSVVYDESGMMLRYDVFPRSNALVLIDPTVILDSPEVLMVAGIGDTLAKWYEADSIIRRLTTRSIEIEVAHWSAKLARDYLLKYSANALLAMETGQCNDSFIKIIETNILLGGMVGGYGDDYGRCSGAHSLHDALTILPESHNQLHGNKVAYGILVQLVLEDRFAEIDMLLPFYKQIGLPISLGEMGMGNVTDANLYAVATRATEPHETIHLMGTEITTELVYQAIKNLETHIAGKEVLKK